MKIPCPVLSILLSLASMASAADFTVTTVSNEGPGSLRQAILDANAAANSGTQDRIVFKIPGTGVHIIDVSSGALPEITDPVIIDGYTQPNARANALAVGNNAIILVQIANTASNVVRTGLHISAGPSIVRGLSITGFHFGVNSHGINLTAPGTGNIIEGNFIGLSPDGQTPGPNFNCINLLTTGNIVGGTTPEARNVIAGNNAGSLRGIWVQRGGNTISGNYIGTNASGTLALSSTFGIQAEAGGFVIGGTGSGAGNLITGTSAGIQLGSFASFLGNIVYLPANGVEVTGNLIGVASDGETPLGNNRNGIHILVSSDTSVGGLGPGAGNVIAFNGGAGVFIDDFGTGPLPINNKILSNSIFGGGPGIAFGYDAPNANDAMDTDEGENHLQNFPIITRTFMSGGTLLIEGTLNSAPNTQYTIQLFSDSYDVLQPGQSLIGTITTMTDNNGNATFSASIPSPFGPANVNATATDPAGNTSEFFLRPSHFRNLSTRGRIQPGEAALIGGFIAQGNSSTSSKIIVRAIGPSLANAGVSGRLEDPVLEIFVGGTRIASNDNWRDNPAVAAEVESHGLAPGNDLESVAVIHIGATPYTAIVTGKNNSSGIGLVEFYDVTGTNLRPVNMSTRGLVQPGDNVLIGGFILQDGNGSTNVVVRAIGPSLASAGIANPLADPSLELRNSNGALLLGNNNWQDWNPAELNAVGLAPMDPKEAAFLLLLDPGAYTAIVRGEDDSTGIALVEFYQLP